MKTNNKLYLYLICIFATQNISLQAQVATENYIIEQTPYTSSSVINPSASVKNITYYDGLGRPMQEVAIGSSPTGKDLVRPIVYDAIGRQDKQYLPYERTGTNGIYTPTATALSNQTAYYNSMHTTVNGPYAYSQTHFEASPLNRVLKQAAPGKAWNDKPQQFAYRSNTVADAIKIWNVTAVTIGETSIVQASTYAANQLYLTQSTDEDGLITREFKDKTGQVIETQQVSGATILRTSYVYDNIGNLRYVIPPKAQGIVPAHADFKVMTYQYAYNSRNLCIAKKLPDSNPIYMVYDSRDRLVFIQDGNMRTSNQWKGILYDALNRPVAEGLTTTTLTHAQMEANCVNKFANQTVNIATYTLTSLNTTIPALTANTVLSYTYYDDYAWATGNMVYLTDSFPYSSPRQTQVKGKVTGTKVKVLDGTELTATARWLQTAYYYDTKYNLMQVRREDYLGTTTGVATIKTNYTFDGLPDRIEEIRSVGALTLNNYYTYDHARRLTAIKQKINNQAEKLLSTITYDALGRIKTKALGNNETINYAYNIRNWLNGINQGNINNNNSKFAMQLYYDDAPATAAKRYNGNVAAADWKHPNVAKQTYNYAYDGFNRLTAGTHAGNYNEKDITYDVNGNISKLVRQGGANAATYTYTYVGNQARTINNLNYAYDANGNMTTDGLKGMIVKYNYLNRPKEVSKATNKLEYIYSAAGEKLAKKLNNQFTQYYTPGVVYKADKTIDYVIHSEGLAHNVNNTYSYQYNLTDHLGNVRVVLDQSNNVVQKTDYYPFGLAHAVSNTHKNKYLYNGKELQDELIGGRQLNTLDYGARHYDPVIGRWTNPDPLTEKYFAFSPYNYVINNPLKHIDPDGKRVKYIYTQTSGGGGIAFGVYGLKQEGVAYDKIGKTFFSRSGGANIANQAGHIGSDRSVSAQNFRFVVGADVGYTIGASYDWSSDTFLESNASYKESQISVPTAAIFGIAFNKNSLALNIGVQIGAAFSVIPTSINQSVSISKFDVNENKKLFKGILDVDISIEGQKPIFGDKGGLTGFSGIISINGTNTGIPVSSGVGENNKSNNIWMSNDYKRMLENAQKR